MKKMIFAKLLGYAIFVFTIPVNLWNEAFYLIIVAILGVGVEQSEHLKKPKFRLIKK